MGRLLEIEVNLDLERTRVPVRFFLCRIEKPLMARGARLRFGGQVVAEIVLNELLLNKLPPEEPW
jgi:hypothetical protein